MAKRTLWVLGIIAVAMAVLIVGATHMVGSVNETRRSAETAAGEILVAFATEWHPDAIRDRCTEKYGAQFVGDDTAKQATGSKSVWAATYRIV